MKLYILWMETRMMDKFIYTPTPVVKRFEWKYWMLHFLSWVLYENYWIVNQSCEVFRFPCIRFPHFIHPVIQKVCFIQFLQSYKISSSGFLSIWFEIMHKCVSLILNTYSQYFLSEIIFLLNFNLVFRRYWRESMELKT